MLATTERIIKHGITPQIILDSAQKLARLQELPERNSAEENLIAESVRIIMPQARRIALTSGGPVAFGLRVSVLDMTTQLYVGDSVHHTGLRVMDVNFWEFHRGHRRKPSSPNPNRWYLAVVDQKLGWMLHIKVEDLLAVAHKGNHLI